MTINYKILVCAATLGTIAVGAQADLVASYGFQGTLGSDISGPDLNVVGTAGSYSTTTLYSQTRQVYNITGSQGAGNNSGLELDRSGILGDGSSYSLEVMFSVTEGAGWRKVYDNSDRTLDQGLYVSPNSHMDYYPQSEGTAPIATDTFYNVIMTYDAGSNATDIYVNGTLDSSTIGSDPALLSSFEQMNFMVDDAATGFNEYSPSSVALIKAWDNVLSADDVSTIERDPFTPSGTPEPFTMALGVGGIALAIRRRIKNRS